MKRTRGLRPVSKRRRQRDKVYAQRRRQVFDRAEGRCEVGCSWGCTDRVEEIHHRAGRGGKDPHRLSNLLGVCNPCHGSIHAWPQVSYDRGWMVKRNGIGDAEGEAYEPGDVA